MAKWGEGDPRWIVEERADATNVNNWHWSEKNATQWSKDKIKTLLNEVKVDDADFEGQISEVSTLDGEATANNRKSKLIFFYEWVIKGEWKGKRKGEKTSYKGKFEVANLSDENSADELEISFTTESNKEEANEIKNFLRKNGVSKVREALAAYIKELKEEYGKDLIKPTDKSVTNNSPQHGPTMICPNTTNLIKQTASLSTEDKKAGPGVKINCKTLTDTINFKCRAEDIYRALTDRQMVQAFTRGEVTEFLGARGEKFILFGGNVSGEFVALDPNQMIEMRWRFKSWPPEHYSNVKITFKEKDDSTDIKLIQKGIPENDYDRTEAGWKQYYWESIKQTFGFGSHLF